MAKLQIVFLLVLLTVLKLSAQESDITFGVFRQKEYYFSNSFKLNWFKAVEYCRLRGMFLLSVRNPEEREAVIEYLTSTGYPKTHSSFIFWTSGNDLGEEGEFHWASTGERFNYLNWRQNEPSGMSGGEDSRKEDCCHVEYWSGHGANYNYTFNDRSCDHKLLFLCETLPA
ncbi:C-type lectin 37Db-like [Anopheles marshallii]|uniref:C-type lectin 37Db-like n=1 Tax=Anopheles marshallii TaxID=1521116 RepID=UPI00237A8128|nr:C-type lectin 37Db-like [Anopheles marshallii]